MKKIKQVLMTALVAATLIPAAAMADTYIGNDGYLVDSRGELVMSGAQGVCWHTTEWTPAMAVAGCDPTKKQVVAAPPVAQPIVVAAAPQSVTPPALVSQKVSFSGDALFAFDQSTLKPEGKAMLDDLVRKMDGSTYDTILAVGHTDRFGSNAYNQKLSERRANTVKAYLQDKNVPAARIDAEGKGETQPITKLNECRGAKTAGVVACLQADRRVDVEMLGTKLITKMQ